MSRFLGVAKNLCIVVGVCLLLGCTWALFQLFVVENVNASLARQQLNTPGRLTVVAGIIVVLGVMVCVFSKFIDKRGPRKP